jgi:hypothetical protein
MKTSAICKIKALKLTFRGTEAPVNTSRNPTVAFSFNKHRTIRNNIKHKILMQGLSEKTYCNTAPESYKTGFDAVTVLSIVDALKPPIVSVCTQIKTRTT